MKKPFTTKLLILYVLLALSFTGCKDDDDDNVDPITDANTCQLVKETYVGDDDYTDYEYNAQGYLTKIIFKEVGSSAANDYALLSYNINNQIVKMEYYEGGQKENYYTFEYTNDLLTTLKDYDEQGNLNSVTTYKYNSNKRMIEEETDEDTHKYTYDSRNNVSKVERVYLGAIIYRETYENYDDKISPAASVKGFPSFLSGASQNNPGKRVTYYDLNQDGVLQTTEVESTYTYTYKYND